MGIMQNPWRQTVVVMIVRWRGNVCFYVIINRRCRYWKSSREYTKHVHKSQIEQPKPTVNTDTIYDLLNGHQGF